MVCVVVLGILVLGASAAPTTDDYSFQVAQDNPDECRTTINRTIIYTNYIEGPDGELIEMNVTEVIVVPGCCEGFSLVGPNCVRNDEGVSNSCGSNVCEAVPDAQCVVFNKCGRELALFMKDGSIANHCHDDNMESLSCSGVCVQDPCLHAECPGFEASEVLCSVSGCDCQVTWIHIKERAEVDCLTGEVISKQGSRRRRQTC